jgi:hypothetical protein
MKKITNREELNQYYKQVNELVDEYITGHNIRPSEVYHYFQRNLQSFLERTGLSDVDGIKKVVNDVLEHRRHMELDKVMKFESFNKLNESVLSIGNATVEHEKVLADYYNTSIGHIDLVDGDIHLYKINDFGKKVISIIFSDSELQKVKENVLDGLVSEAENKVLSINEIGGVGIGVSFRFWLSDVFDKEKFRATLTEKITNENLLLIIKSTIQKNQELPTNFSSDRLNYKDDFKGYHIWEVR